MSPGPTPTLSVRPMSSARFYSPMQGRFSFTRQGSGSIPARPHLHLHACEGYFGSLRGPGTACRSPRLLSLILRGHLLVVNLEVYANFARAVPKAKTHLQCVKLFCVPGNRSTTTLGANPSFTSTAPSASRMFSCRNSHSNLPAGTANTESLDDISKVITSHCGHFKSISAPLALFARALLPLSPGSAQRVPGDLRTGIDAPSRLHSIQDQTRLNLCM
ncbi:hypothetical protein C8R43DRAFT_1122424 [Mycena crocata]|nr:hypothetical protein C8R43DRAFT_1122424 [Mycena crocata]